MKWFLVFSIFLSFGCSELTTLKKSSYKVPQPKQGILDKYKPNNEVEHFLVIIGGNTELHHQGNISFAYQVLLERGYKYAKTFIFDHNSNTPYFPQTDTTTLEGLTSFFKALKEKMDQNDTLLVYITGHGTRINNKSYVMLNPTEVLSIETLNSLLNEMFIGQGLLIVDGCYWKTTKLKDNCLWNVITVSTEKTTSSGTTFPRLFWKHIREEDNDFKKAFEYAIKYDINTKLGNNNPSMKVATCPLQKMLLE